MNVINVVIIGAGTSGLCAAKHAQEQGLNVTVYEQNDVLGGHWWYTDATGKDKYGVKIHTAMYQGVRTILPNQLMAYPDHPYPEDVPSFPPHPRVLEFLQSYVKRFDLTKLIKFSHNMIRVSPIDDGKWEVIVKDQPNDVYVTRIFDAVFVCNGRYSMPRISETPGIGDYKGKMIHSHDFRKADNFRGQRVLIIGNGASGIDMVQLLAHTSQHTTFSVKKQSHEAFEKLRDSMPANCTLQDVVKRFTPTGAEFIDGVHDTFDTVIWAIGYDLSYRFLSTDCGMHVDDRFLQPLYKQIFNIHYPTMVFIGIPHLVGTTRMYDLQVRFALKFVTGVKKFPGKAEMLQDMWNKAKIQWDKGYTKRETHQLGPEQMEYFTDLAETGDVVNMPPVLAAMHADATAAMFGMPTEYRKYKYTIIDDQTFKKEKVEE